MSVKLKTRCMIAAICITASACTEKTIIREVPADNTANAVIGVPIEQTPGTSVSTETTSSSVADPVTQDTSATVANMVDGPEETPAANGYPVQQSTENTEQAATTGNDLLLDPDNQAGSENLFAPEPTDQTVTGNTISTDTSNQTGTEILPDSTSQTSTGNGDVLDPDSQIGTEQAGIEQAGAGNLPDDTSSLQSDPVEPESIGEPGMSVNCKLDLPCQWVSADKQFTVTVTNADNIGNQNRLRIEYTLLTVHDTEVLIANTEPAVDGAGIQYEPTALTLGEGIGGRVQGVIAGSPVAAHVEFDSVSTAASLDSWSIGLSDAGLVRQPVFTNIPVGSATQQLADCANTLPCAWESPTGDATITLIAVSGFGSTNRLSANFRIDTRRNTVVAVDAGATAVGSDGLSYKGRTHAIGLETGPEKITANTVSGAQVAGTVYFFRTQSMSNTLQNLSLIVYEDRPVPRWNPGFLSVPVR